MAQPTPSDAASFSSPVAIIGPQYCVPNPVNLSMQRKALSRKSVVTDINGNIIFKVEEKGTWFHGRKISLLDPAGNTIVTVRRKGSTSSSRQVSRGESKDEKDIIFAVKPHFTMFAKFKLDVFLANNTAKRVCDFKVKASNGNRSCTIHAGDEDSKNIVAKMDKEVTAESILRWKEKFMMTIYPNIDYAFIVALIVILDDVVNK